MVTLVPSHTSVAVGLVKTQAVPHSTVEFGVQVIVGAVVSITVTVWLQAELLVQESVALHVRVALNVFPQKPVRLVVVVTVWLTLVPSHTSETVGWAKAQVVPHSTTWLLPQVIWGAVVSTTVMVWLHVEVLVQASVALHVRVALNVFPQKPMRLVVVVTITVALVPSHTSKTVGWAKAQLVPHSTIWLFPQVIWGAVVSTTLMVRSE